MYINKWADTNATLKPRNKKYRSGWGNRINPATIDNKPLVISTYRSGSPRNRVFLKEVAQKIKRAAQIGINKKLSDANVGMRETGLSKNQKAMAINVTVTAGIAIRTITTEL